MLIDFYLIFIPIATNINFVSLTFSDNYVRLPPSGPNQDWQLHTKNEVFDEQSRQSVLVQKRGSSLTNIEPELL